MSGKQIWIIEDDGNLLVKFREVQQSWKSTSGQHVPVHLCRKVAESNMYRYTFNMYRYTYAEKWQRVTCTGTPLTCTGTPV